MFKFVWVVLDNVQPYSSHHSYHFHSGNVCQDPPIDHSIIVEGETHHTNP